MILGGFGGRDDRGQNPIALLIMLIVAPIAAMIVQLAISRQNEFQADATAARITRDPGGLASALQHIEGYAKQIPMAVNPAAAQLAIINPLAGPRRQAFAGLFRTHPPTEERIARLQQIQL
jgi:heat shock protein HtpX